MVNGYAYAEFVALAEIVLSNRVTTFCCQLIPLGGLRLILRHTLTGLVKKREIVLAGDASIFRRKPVKPSRFFEIFWHALTSLC